MRLLVDTTVWVDYFRGRDTTQVRQLEERLRQGDDICYCGFVLTEILRGIGNDQEHRRVQEYFSALVYLPENRATFELAAEIYRDLRRRGYTIRNAMDCLIAAVVAQHGVSILENDRDYRHIDRFYPLNRL